MEQRPTRSGRSSVAVVFFTRWRGVRDRADAIFRHGNNLQPNHLTTHNTDTPYAYAYDHAQSSFIRGSRGLAFTSSDCLASPLLCLSLSPPSLEENCTMARNGSSPLVGPWAQDIPAFCLVSCDMSAIVPHK